MQTTFKRIAMWTLFLLACPSCLMAQQATVKRNVNLRSDPSTVNPPIELLRGGATLTILDSTPKGATITSRRRTARKVGSGRGT
jgi:uncharacterized protein YraI